MKSLLRHPSFPTLLKNDPMRKITPYILLATSLLSVSTVMAHEPSFIDMPSQLLLKSAMGVQNTSIVANDQAWLIPGVMLGGESTPQSSGTAINDLQLFGRLNLEDDYYLASKIGFHQHQGEGELELENYWFGKYFKFENSILKIDVGKMATDVTPTANYHSSQDEFNTKPLLAEAFFGGHHKDTGVKANWYWHELEVGLEAWNGDSWPTSSSKGNVAGFVRYHGFIYGVKTDVASWYSAGKAEQRIDSRYDSGHSHSATTITAPDVRFTGDVAMAGSYVLLSQQVNDDFLWLAQWEWMHSEQDGKIEDTTQSAGIDQTLDGYRFMLGLNYQTHKFFVQQEYLAINNKFTDASTSLIEQQGLYNQGFEPQRLMFGYHWQWNANFTLRIESVSDKTQSYQDGLDKTQQYWSLGLIWQHKLL